MILYQALSKSRGGKLPVLRHSSSFLHLITTLTRRCDRPVIPLNTQFSEYGNSRQIIIYIFFSNSSTLISTAFPRRYCCFLKFHLRRVGMGQRRLKQHTQRRERRHFCLCHKNLVFLLSSFCLFGLWLRFLHLSQTHRISLFLSKELLLHFIPNFIDCFRCQWPVRFQGFSI